MNMPGGAPWPGHYGQWWSPIAFSRIFLFANSGPVMAYPGTSLSQSLSRVLYLPCCLVKYLGNFSGSANFYIFGTIFSMGIKKGFMSRIDLRVARVGSVAIPGCTGTTVSRVFMHWKWEDPCKWPSYPGGVAIVPQCRGTMATYHIFPFSGF